ncbi:MAG: STAS domain-containing protein [Planctomycetota bacterium]
MSNNPITDTHHADTTVVARLTGSLTVVNAPDLRGGLLALIKQHSPTVLALNLDAVDFVDSSALGVFVEARRQMVAENGSVAFTNVNKEVRGLMRIMNLDAVFSFAESEDDLLAGAE